MNEDAATLVNQFIIQMHLWEEYCNQLEEDKSLGDAEEEKLQKNKLRSIFKKHCTERKRPEGRLGNIAYGEKGSYDYDPEKMITSGCEITSSGWIITVDNDCGESVYQFVVKKNRKGLFIDSKKRFSSWKKKWVTDTL